MSVTVYNATTGRYVTTLNVSAGAKKQASTAAIKSKEGGQAAPLKPVASSVKVSLSATAKAVIAGTAKLKASELFTKMQQSSYSPADLSGTTLYVEKVLKDLLPPAVPGSNKVFDLASVRNSSNKTIAMSMADMGLRPVEYREYNGPVDPTTIQWWGQDNDGNWTAVSNDNLPERFAADGTIAVDYTILPESIKAYKNLRADFSRVPNYEKLLILLTAQGGRKLVDVRANNDGPVAIDEAAFKQIQNDMRNPTLVKAGASKVTETIVTPTSLGSKPITLVGKPGDVVRWYKQADDPNVAGVDLLGWEEVKDTRVPARAPVVIAANGTASIKVSDLPADLQSSAKIKAEVHSSSLLDVLGNVTLDLPVTKDANGEELPVAAEMDSAILARFRQMIDTNQATKVTIGGQSGQRTLTPDLVTRLGAKTIARYSGDIIIDATTGPMLTQENWESLRVLNNYRSLAINLDMGVPSTRTPVGELSSALSRMSYQQFIGGYSLLNAISVKPSPIALVPSLYDAATKTQKLQISGLFLNGDSVQMSLLAPDGTNVSLSAGPLVLPKGASPQDQVNALRDAVDAALKAKKGVDLSKISVSVTSNELSLRWPSDSSGPSAPMSVGTIPNGNLVPGLYDSRSRTQAIAVTEGFQPGDRFGLTLINGDDNPVNIQVGPLLHSAGADKAAQIAELVAKIQSAIDGNGSVNAKVMATGDPANALSLQWVDSGPAGIPPATFIGSTRAQEYAVSFGTDLFNVPPSAVESLVSYPQVTGLEVAGNNDQILNNTDKLNKLLSTGFVKRVQLTTSNTGQFLLTAAQAARAIPAIEKLSSPVVSITDKRSSPTSYASFTDAAARNLRGGIQIIGTSAELSNALRGLGSLTRASKITSVTLLGANGRQTIFDNFDASKLSQLTARLRKGG